MMMVGLCGCAQFHDAVDEISMTVRNRCASHHAWWTNKGCYKGIDYRCFFGCGFKQGYFDVASGSDGCLPLLPPRHMWGIHFQNPVGQQMIVAWFNGYAEGALVAQEEGIAAWSQIVTSAQFEDTHCQQCQQFAEEVLYSDGSMGADGAGSRTPYIPPAPDAPAAEDFDDPKPVGPAEPYEEPVPLVEPAPSAVPSEPAPLPAPDVSHAMPLKRVPSPVAITNRSGVKPSAEVKLLEVPGADTFGPAQRTKAAKVTHEGPVLRMNYRSDQRLPKVPERTVSRFPQRQRVLAKPSRRAQPFDNSVDDDQAWQLPLVVPQ
jgi:hypothetical protein